MQKETKQKRYSISVYPRQAQMSLINERYRDYLEKINQESMASPLSLSGFLLALIQEKIGSATLYE
jgi:hypothetical protein